MARQGETSEWKPGSKGVTEALIGAGVGYCLLPLVALGWEHFFHSDPPEWAKGAVPNLVGAVVLGPAAWLLAAWARRRREGRQRVTAKAKGDRISIYVARFGEDEIGREARESVIASIQRELGGKNVEILPAGLQLKLRDGTSVDEALKEATQKARVFLKKQHGDLLLWGAVHTIGQRSVIELRFISAAQDGLEGSRFGFEDKYLTLEPSFGPEIGAAVAAVAAAMALPAIQDPGKYIAKTLAPVANRLARLAENIPASMQTDDRANLLLSYGLIRQAIGTQSGESRQLTVAVEAYRAALQEWTRDRVPLDWAMTQNNLGIALFRLGERESGTERLVQAVEAYRAALQEWTRDRVPLDWARAQNNLGLTLFRLGERESGTEKLEQAVEAYRAALQEWTRDRAPLDWAGVQNNLGIALRSLGNRESGTENLEQAVEAYRETLQEWTRKRVALHWAMTQNNLGNALSDLGERESGTEKLEQAVEAYRAALMEWTRDRVPLDWAKAQNNLGTALRNLGERESGTENLEQAVEAYREALMEWTRDRVPLDWAGTQNNLGNALSDLGERESGTENLEQAVEAYREALKEWTRDRVPRYHDIAQSGLERASMLLEMRRHRSP